MSNRNLESLFGAQEPEPPKTGDETPSQLDASNTKQQDTTVAPATPVHHATEWQLRPAPSSRVQAQETPAKKAWTKRGRAAQQREQDIRDMLAVQSLNRPRTILVANSKGGASKTPTSILLASVFAAHTSVRPVVIDTNPVGNLASRLEFCPPTARTIDDLAEHLDEVRAQPNRIREFLSHQPSLGFDALPSRERKIIESPDGRHMLDRATISFDEMLGVWDILPNASGLLIADSGNSVNDDPWKAQITRADALVIPVRWQEDHCEGAYKVLDTLANIGYGSLASTAILVETTSVAADPKVKTRYSEFFKSNGLRIFSIPIDPHLAQNKAIMWNQLKPSTREAMVTIGGVVARQLLTAS